MLAQDDIAGGTGTRGIAPEREIDPRVGKRRARDPIDDNRGPFLHVDLRRTHVRTNHDFIAVAPGDPDVALTEIVEQRVQRDDGAGRVVQQLQEGVRRLVTKGVT